MQETKNILAIPLAIVVAGILVAGAIFFTRGGAHAGPTGDTGVKQSTTVAAVTKEDHILGNPNAKVTVVEYSDLECPFCKAFDATMRQVMDAYGKSGDVAWVYRHFPLSQIHPHAEEAAEASECVFEQGGDTAFFAFAGSVFQNQPASLTALDTYAASAGVDATKFKSCLASGKYKDKVAADAKSGEDAGVSGTPYSFIVLKGSTSVVPINGAQPYSVVKQAIDALLGDQPAQ